MNNNLIKLFLRMALSIGFLSAVADRFGLWGKEVSAWGNWDTFLASTKVLNPWFTDALIPIVGAIATGAEIILALCLILGFKTELMAKLSGVLLIMFALSMTFSTGVKSALDYSVYSAAAAAFALGTMKQKWLELDNLLTKSNL